MRLRHVGERLAGLDHVGFGCASRADLVEWTTKLEGRDAETAKRQLEEALSDLKTDHVDILHFHGLATTDEIDRILADDGALKVYRRWKEEGVIGAIGVTGTSAANALAREADVILAIGTRLQDFTTGSRTLFENAEARIIGLNVQPFDAGKQIGRASCRERV